MNTSLVSFLIFSLVIPWNVFAGGNGVGTMGLTGSGGTALMQGFGSEDLIKYAERISRHMPAAGVEMVGQSYKSYEGAVRQAERNAKDYCGVKRAVRLTSWVYKYDVVYHPAPGCDDDEPRYCPETPIPTYFAKAKFTCSN